MTKMTHRGMLLLAFAIGCAACDGQSPSAPTPPPPAAASAPTVTADLAVHRFNGPSYTGRDLSGTGFLAAATVTVDVAAVSVTVVNSTTITAIVPARAAGQADVVVTNPGWLRRNADRSLRILFRRALHAYAQHQRD